MPFDKILYDYVMRFVGLPYRWGGDDPIQGFDCSGLMLELLWSQGMGPGVDTTAQGLREFYSKSQLAIGQFGALAFYGTPQKATHVAFCLNHLLMVEAGGGGSTTVNEDIAAKQNAVVRIRPTRKRKDLIGFVLPPWPFLFEGKV